MLLIAEFSFFQLKKLVNMVNMRQSSYYPIWEYIKQVVNIPKKVTGKKDKIIIADDKENTN